MPVSGEARVLLVQESVILSGESFSWLGRLIILYAMKMPAPKAATLFLFYRTARTSGQQIIPPVRVQLSGYNNR